MNDIFTEVDEDLRRDKALEFWNKHRNLILAGVVAILVGTAISVLWKNYQAGEAEKEGRAYRQALLTSENKTGASEDLSRIAQSGGPFRKLAQFQLADKALQAKDKERAQALLMTLAEDKNDPAAAQLARMEAAYIALDLKKYDQVDNLLAPLLTENNPYRALAMEASLLSALQRGDHAGAKKLYDALKPLTLEPNAPSGLKERLEILDAEMGA